MDAERIAAGLTDADRIVVRKRGIAYSTRQFRSSLFRHLERKGLFVRREIKGFSTRWQLTPKGEAVRAVIEKEMK